MANYTKTVDFAAKDSLPSGDPNKVVRGSEFEVEFDNISTAIATKANSNNSALTGSATAVNLTVSGTLTAANVVVSGNVDGRDVSVDGTKLDTIETNADVTDTANVTAAGALMDSELTNETAVKALNQGVSTTDDVTFGTITADGLTFDGVGENAIIEANTTSSSINTSGELLKLRAVIGPAQTEVGNIVIQNRGSGENQSLIRFQTADAGTIATRMDIDFTGDISFYEDTGTTAKFFWDASAERLGIGGVADARLEVLAPSTQSSDIAFFSNSAGVQKAIIRLDAQGDGEFVLRDASNSEDVVITAGGDTYFNGGNVGIGTSSPSVRLDVNAGSSSNPAKLSSSAALTRVLVENTDSTEKRTDIAFTSNSAIRGVVGFDGSNLEYDARSAAEHVFKLTGAERMRIDASGNLLVGTTDSNPVASNVQGLSLLSSGTAGFSRESGNPLAVNRVTDDGTVVSIQQDSIEVGTISVSGSTTSYNTSSDVRLKENITDAPAGTVDALQVRSFDWKVDGSHQEYGFIAQELEPVAPYAVTKGETEDDMWSVDYSKLVPMLVKEIQDLKARIATLEAN